MAQNDFTAETPDNYEQKCLCVLILDTSGSMVGEPIKELNKGLKAFYYQVMKDETAAERLEVCLITFESIVKCVQEPSLLRNFKMPTLEAAGSTRMVDAVKEAIIKVNYRKMWYRKTGQPYYRPFVFLITDGDADADQDLEELMFEVNAGVNEKKFIFFPIGVQDANMDHLRYIAHPSTPPMKLTGLNFVEFFQWLSNSVGVIAQSKDGDYLQLPNTGSWGQVAI